MFTGGCIFSSRCLLQQPEHVFVLHIRLREHGLCGFGEDVGADVFCQLPRHVRIAQRRVAGLDVRDLRHEVRRRGVEAVRLRAERRVRVQQILDGLVDVFEEDVRFFARIDGVLLVKRQVARRVSVICRRGPVGIRAREQDRERRVRQAKGRVIAAARSTGCAAAARGGRRPSFSARP